MFNREKIFTVYEKPEAADPAERMVLLRDGFSFGAFLFSGLWLILQRMWRVLLGYIVVTIALAMLCDTLHLTDAARTLCQLWLQLMLAFHAYDLKGWELQRRGYRMGGILAAETQMHAERRYHEFAA